MYRIRAFGDDMTCQSVDELHECLVTHYRGRSVSLAYEAAPHGMQRTRFVDVLEDGRLQDSYGEQNPVDFEAIEADRAGPAPGR